MKQFAAKLFARYIVNKNKRWKDNPIAAQEKTFKLLVEKARNTRFGQDHDFDQIDSYESFKAKVPVRDYEGHRPYVEQIIAGEKDVISTDRGIPSSVLIDMVTTSPSFIKSGRSRMFFSILIWL